MVRKILNKVKGILYSWKNQIIRVTAALMYAYLTMPITVHASGSYTAPLDNLKIVLLTIMGSAGVIVICWGIATFAIAFKKMDQNGEWDAIKTFACGCVLTGASVILAVLGV